MEQQAQRVRVFWFRIPRPFSNGSLVLFVLGIGSLMLGLAIYMFARGQNTSPLVELLSHIGIHHFSKNANAWVPGWLPSVMHVFGFSLITNAILTDDDGFVGFSVIFWVVINLILEFAQWDGVIIAWMKIDNLTGTNFSQYWKIRGDFSMADLVGVIVGGAAAYVTISHVRKFCLLIKTFQ